MPAQTKTLFDIARKVTGQIRAITSDQRGVSAIEFSFFAALLAFGLLNTADISIYIYKRMEVENATEMGAQAAWKTCDPSKGYLPATTSCPSLTTAVTNGVQSTSLGSQVSLQSGTPSEGYYCLSNGSLTEQTAITASYNGGRPFCSDGTAAKDYITIATTYSYAPLFPGITVASAFATPILKQSMMRLD